MEEAMAIIAKEGQIKGNAQKALMEKMAKAGQPDHHENFYDYASEERERQRQE